MRKGERSVGVLVVIFLISIGDIFCQVGPVGARSGSLAGIRAGLEDIWAGLNNPAGLAKLSQFSLGTSLEQRFLMKELGYYAVTTSIPVRTGVMGVSGLFTGYQSYSAQTFSLAYGMPFGKNIMAGASLVYIFQKAGNESQGLHLVSYKIGTIVGLSDKISLALVTFNPFQLSYKSEEYVNAPSDFIIGLSYQYNSSLLIIAELEKNLDYPFQIKTGIEFSYNERFVLRGGIRGFPASYSFGAALRVKKIQIEMASCYHQYLGFTPLLTLQYDLR